MKKGMKKFNEFKDLNDFMEYVLTYMKNIKKKKEVNAGMVEIHLIAGGETIGIWRPEQDYGYIEEYRTEERLLKEASNG